MFLLDEECEIIHVKFGSDNNYINSTVRWVANQCPPAIRAINVLGEYSFVPPQIDLLSHDGLVDYGTCKGDLFGILIHDMYRDNRKNIELSCMWLSTPYSTSNGYGSGYAVCVRSDGYVDYDWCGNCGSVRPFFILKPDIFVSLVE